MKLTIFSTFIVGLGISVLLLLGSIVYSYTNSRNLFNSLTWVEHTYSVIDELDLLQHELLECESGVRGYVISGASDLVKDYPKKAEFIQSINKRLRNLTKDNLAQQIKFSQLEQSVDRRVALFAETIRQKQAGSIGAHLPPSQAKAISQLNREIRQAIFDLRMEEKVLLAIHQNRSKRDLSHTRNTILLAGVIGVVIVCLVIIITINYIRTHQKAEDELRRLNENKNRFFSIIGHDLRGPIRNYQAMLHMIMDEQANLNEQESRQMLELMEKSTVETGRLLEDLLFWGNIQMKQVACKPEVSSIQQLAEESLAVLQPIATMKNIRLYNQIEPEFYVYADRSMIRTVIRNLVSNAIKFTPAGGEVRLRAQFEHPHIAIRIEDTGVGMTEEVRNKLFVFGTKNTTRGTANEKGSGLGLIICKELIEMNGGNIEVESEQGKGSTFQFTLSKAPISLISTGQALATA